jgi:hypothetical protein
MIDEWNNVENDGRVFSEELLVGVKLSDSECQAFRENSKKYTMQDPFYKDSITFYRSEDGVILVDSFEIFSEKAKKCN